MSLKDSKKDGRYLPDNQVEALVTDLVDTALDKPEMIGFKYLVLIRYAMSLKVANDFDTQLARSVDALGYALQNAFTVVKDTY